MTKKGYTLPYACIVGDRTFSIIVMCSGSYGNVISRTKLKEGKFELITMWVIIFLMHV